MIPELIAGLGGIVALPLVAYVVLTALNIVHEVAGND